MAAQPSDFVAMPTTDEGRRELAVKRLRAKHEFRVHLFVYLCVNAMLTLIWAFTALGRPFPAGFFWPIIPIAGWGIGLVIHGYTAYQNNTYTPEQVEREMRRLPS